MAMDKIRIGHLTTAYHTAFILMGTDWLENKAGIKAAWSMFPTGPAMMKAFHQNELDIGYVGLPPAMIEITKGTGLRCIAGGHVEGTVVIAKGDLRTFEETGSMRDTLKQLIGKVVGTPSKGSIHDVLIRTMLEESGLQREVEVRNYPWADLALDAMERDEVQAAAGTPSLAVVGRRLTSKAKILIPPNRIWPYNPSYGIVAAQEAFESSANVLKRFLTLHEGACNLIRGYPRAAAKVASRTAGIMDEGFVYEVYKVSPKYCASIPGQYINATMEFVPVLQKMGYIPKKLDEQDVFQKSLIQDVHQGPPHYDDPLALAQ